MYAQRPCELFENEVFLDEVSDVLCIAQAGKLWTTFFSKSTDIFRERGWEREGMGYIEAAVSSLSNENNHFPHPCPQKWLCYIQCYLPPF